MSYEIEGWDFCTHKHADKTLQKSGPCPRHEAIGYCIVCAQFIFEASGWPPHAEAHNSHAWAIERITPE